MTTNFQNMITVGTPAKWTPAIGTLVDTLIDIVDVLDSDDEITVPARLTDPLCLPTLRLSGRCPIGAGTVEAIAIWLAAKVLGLGSPAAIAAEYFCNCAEVTDECYEDIDAADLMDAIGEVLDLDTFADDDDAARLAVARHLGCPLSEVETGIGSGPYGYGITIIAEGDEYAVLTDDEADEAWDEALESYLDECVEGADAPYFDRDAWKRDAKYDGRGHCLNGYDGSEECEVVNGEWLYIYRTN